MREYSFFPHHPRHLAPLPLSNDNLHERVSGTKQRRHLDELSLLFVYADRGCTLLGTIAERGHCRDPGMEAQCVHSPFKHGKSGEVQIQISGTIQERKSSK